MRGFKAQHTNEYVKKPKDNVEHPYVKYSLIDRKVWEDFVKFRTTHEFLAKSPKSKKSRARNIYPHRLSRGEYDKLEQRMINEK